MTTLSVLIGIGVGVLALVGAFFRIAFMVGKFTERFDDLEKQVKNISNDVKQLKKWRYSSAVRNQGRGRGLPGD